MTKKKKKKPPKKKEKYSVKQIREAIEGALGNISVAAIKLRCTRQMIYNYIERHPTLKDVLDKSREGAKDFVESALMQNIKDGNVTAQIFWLKTQAKDRGYVERQEHDHRIKTDKGYVGINPDDWDEQD